METLWQFMEKNDFVCGDGVKVYSNGKMEVPSTVGVKEKELPNLFCQEGFVCNNLFEDQYYAGGSTSTEEGRMQTK